MQPASVTGVVIGAEGDQHQKKNDIEGNQRLPMLGEKVRVNGRKNGKCPYTQQRSNDLNNQLADIAYIGGGAAQNQAAEGRCDQAQKQQDHIAKFSYPGMQADTQGRVLLPAKLRQYVLGDAKDVEISGALDHIRVIDSVAAQEEDDYYREHRDEIQEQIADLDP